MSRARTRAAGNSVLLTFHLPGTFIMLCLLQDVMDLQLSGMKMEPVWPLSVDEGYGTWEPNPQSLHDPPQDVVLDDTDVDQHVETEIFHCPSPSWLGKTESFASAVKEERPTNHSDGLENDLTYQVRENSAIKLEKSNGLLFAEENGMELNVHDFRVQGDGVADCEPPICRDTERRNAWYQSRGTQTWSWDFCESAGKCITLPVALCQTDVSITAGTKKEVNGHMEPKEKRKDPLFSVSKPTPFFQTGSPSLQKPQDLGAQTASVPIGMAHGHTIASPGRQRQPSHKGYQCKECGKVCADPKSLKCHYRIHTGERPYLCRDCGKAFTQQANLDCHRRTHTGEKPYQCTVCSKAFTQQAHLTRHLLVHTGEKPYQCMECGKAFAHVKSLDCHRRTHTGERPYCCGDCGKTFTQAPQLECHRRTHTGERPFQCTSCGKAFAQQAHLKRHLLTHTGERPYQCMDCGKAFGHMKSLECHRRTHTGEKPYLCRDCGKAFTQQANLVCHRRTHTGEKPYQCIDCGKAFAQLAHLQRHLLIHTGEKPFPCLVCGKAFARQAHLERHMLTHTTTEAIPPYCAKAFLIEAMEPELSMKIL
uniref:zinc finger protein 879-like isoform X2 n=1 Tax=Myxine glutinosa TaxID=7769 RepID=UPI00358E1972